VKMDRRQFVAAVGAVPLLLSQGAAEEAKHTTPGDTRTMDNSQDELVAPCGRYCGDCGICGSAISLKMTAVASAYEATGIHKEASKMGWPVMKGIAEKACTDFEADLRSFSEWTQKCFPRNCRDSCVPPCRIPKCCADRKLKTCAECSEYENCTMPNLKKSEEAIKNIREIQQNGLESFSKRKREDMVRRIRTELSSAVTKSI
jgi:hypothetical protein